VLGDGGRFAVLSGPEPLDTSPLTFNVSLRCSLLGNSRVLEPDDPATPRLRLFAWRHMASRRAGPPSQQKAVSPRSSSSTFYPSISRTLLTNVSELIGLRNAAGSVTASPGAEALRIELAGNHGRPHRVDVLGGLFGTLGALHRSVAGAARL